MGLTKSRYNVYKSFYDNLDILGIYGLFFGLIVSFFLYGIYWIFNINKKLELVDDNAPNSERGLVIMIIIPFTWFLLHFLLENVLFTGNPKLMLFIEKPLEFLVLISVSLLSLKYFFDFTKSFAKVTFSDNFIWFNLMAPGFIGVILYGFNFTFGLFLLFFPFISILIMQNKLNNTLIEYEKRGISDSFNYQSMGVQR